MGTMSLSCVAVKRFDGVGLFSGAQDASLRLGLWPEYVPGVGCAEAYFLRLSCHNCHCRNSCNANSFG